MLWSLGVNVWLSLQEQFSGRIDRFLCLSVVLRLVPALDLVFYYLYLGLWQLIVLFGLW